MSFNQNQQAQLNAQLQQQAQLNQEAYYAAMDSGMGVVHDNAERNIADLEARKQARKQAQKEREKQQLDRMARNQRVLNYNDNLLSGKKHGSEIPLIPPQQGQKTEDPNHPGYGGRNTKGKRRKTKGKRRKTKGKGRKTKKRTTK